MSLLNENVAMLRRKLGFSQAELAEKLGVRKTTISNYETGYSNPDAKMLSRLADLFSVSVDQLLGRALPTIAGEPPFSDAVSVPVLGTVHAGSPVFAVQDVIDQIYVASDLVQGFEFFGLRVKGDSMNQARLNEGDTLLVRRQDYAYNGDIVVALIEEDATVKRFYRQGDMVILTPESSNREHQPIHVDLTKTKFQIMGKVIRAVISL